MTDREKELVNRYVYEVTKRIPKEQRSEIEMELRELIEDMAEGAPRRSTCGPRRRRAFSSISSMSRKRAA